MGQQILPGFMPTSTPVEYSTVSPTERTFLIEPREAISAPAIEPIRDLAVEPQVFDLFSPVKSAELAPSIAFSPMAPAAPVSMPLPSESFSPASMPLPSYYNVLSDTAYNNFTTARNQKTNAVELEEFDNFVKLIALKQEQFFAAGLDDPENAMLNIARTIPDEISDETIIPDKLPIFSDPRLSEYGFITDPRERWGIDPISFPESREIMPTITTRQRLISTAQPPPVVAPQVQPGVLPHAPGPDAIQPPDVEAAFQEADQKDLIKKIAIGGAAALAAYFLFIRK